MPVTLTEEEIYKEARKRVEEKKAFFTHLSVYFVVNAVLAIIWAVNGAGFPWFLFPLGGWGIGLFFHFMNTFVFNTKFDQSAVEKEAERIRRQHMK